MRASIPCDMRFSYWLPCLVMSSFAHWTMTSAPCSAARRSMTSTSWCQRAWTAVFMAMPILIVSSPPPPPPSALEHAARASVVAAARVTNVNFLRIIALLLQWCRSRSRRSVVEGLSVVDEHPLGRQERGGVVAGRVGQREHRVVDVDPELVLHERAACLDAGPHLGELCGDVGAQLGVGDRKAVLAVDLVAVRDARGDDVALERHARGDRRGVPGAHVRADPLVGRGEVTGVERGGHAAACELLGDELVELTARDARAHGLVPRDDALVVGGHPALDE